MTPKSPTNTSIFDSRFVFQNLQTLMERARATNSHDVHAQTFLLAGRPVQTCIVGRAQAAVFERAFSHLLPAESRSPALTIELWDGCVTSVDYQFTLRGEEPGVRQLSDGELLWSDETARYVWSEKADAVTGLDRKTNRIVGWRADGEHPPTHERSKPLSFLLSLWLYAQDLHVLHAGVVARQNRGIIIAGGSGIGKTTTTCCALRAGFDFLGDDQVAVERIGDKSFRAHVLFSSVRLEPNHLKNFPELQAHALPSIDPLDNKSLVFLGEVFSAQIAQSTEIAALVLPRPSTQDQTFLTPAKRIDAVHYMAPTSLVSPFGVGRRRFELVSQLLGAVPCYWLELGRDLSSIAPVLDGVLDKA